MSFRISGLDPREFTHYASMSDAELARHRAKRCTAAEYPGFPCRVTLDDAQPGEEVILLNYEHLPVESPYRSSHAIYVRAAAASPRASTAPARCRGTAPSNHCPTPCPPPCRGKGIAAMEFKDYYQVLGVARDAPADEIKKSYRKLARKYHPDVSKEPDANTRMKDVNEAWAVLQDPEKRAAYDQVGKGFQPGQDFRPPPDWDAGFEFSDSGFAPGENADFSDFFSQIFGRRSSSRGGDHHAKVMLDIEDAFTGAERQIGLRVPKSDEQGRVTLETRTLNVKIPKGVHAGQMIRLAGQGGAGHGGAPAGDLLLEVQFNSHDRYRVEGRDIHIRLPIAPWEAALGAVVPVQAPGANLEVRIPAGAQSGRQMRVRGKGIPGSTPGDLYLDIQVVLPPADKPEARAIYETMARELAFDPRAEAARSAP